MFNESIPSDNNRLSLSSIPYLNGQHVDFRVGYDCDEYALLSGRNGSTIDYSSLEHWDTSGITIMAMRFMVLGTTAFNQSMENRECHGYAVYVPWRVLVQSESKWVECEQCHHVWQFQHKLRAYH